ncbi:hypothetical protein E3N88_28362 [Mikania micrantha]|uniref:GRAM domain-containing protein n=1 Tax=Mikania micrantha TaxID=192012 RepID=A0A5N6MZU1_9ASTR|nr:hypothetical protein E3N88_28362 [Mikania micrantha]
MDFEAYKNSDDYKVQPRRSAGMAAGVGSSPVSTEDGNLETSGKSKKKQGRKINNFAFRVGDHVKMGPKLSETLKGKLRLGAKIIRKGGRENIFKEVFGEIEGEKLLKASSCYLSTSAGPIAGILFISTQKLAFCSETSIKLTSTNGDLIRKPYKVLIPTDKIKESNERENVKNPAQKYMQIVTADNFEFWFMGFVRYEKAFHNLRKVVLK